MTGVIVQLTGATPSDVTDLPCIAPALGSMATLLGLGTIGCTGTTTTRTVVRRFLDAVLEHDAATPSAATLTSGLTRSGMTMRRAATPLTSKGQSMKAMLQDIYGSPDALHLGDAEKPDPAPNEVLVQVRAAGVDRGTAHLMRGEPYLLRVLGFGFRGPKQPVPGKDLAGTVVQVGSDVTEFEVGDEVFGIADGSFAEYAVARADKLVHKPAGLTFEQAAVVPISATTAMQGLRDVGHVQAGQQVLIIGASGGVGTYAVQIAKALGAEVTGVCSTAKVELVRSLGADEVIDYTREDFADRATRFDLILDIGGNSRISRLRRALAPKGTVVIVGGEGGKWTGVGRQLRAIALSPFVPQRLAMFVNKERYEDLDAVRQLIEAGQVTSIVDRTYPLAEAPDALRHLEAGQARGKIAISI